MPGLKSSKLMAFTHFLLTLKTSVLYNAEELFRGASRGALRRAAGLCTAGSFFHALHCCCFSLGGGVGGGLLLILPVRWTISCPNSPRVTVAAWAWPLALITFANRSGCKPRLDYLNVSVLNQSKIQHIITLGKL